ncbi:MAG: site-specific tyrosine recombinase XerD [Actinomycetes bacterium]
MGSERPRETEIERFLDFLLVERGRSPKTIRSYRSDLVAFDAYLVANRVSVPSATPAEIDSYLEHLRARGLAAASVARSRSSIRGLYQFLVDEGHATTDPSSRIASVRIPSRLPKALREDQVAALIDGVNGDDPLSLRDRAILELLYGTGARVTEAVDLDLDALAYDEGLLRVRGKGDKERLVPVGRATQAALARWLSHEGRDRLVNSSDGRAADGAVFVNTKGRRITRQGIHLMVSTRARRAGLTTAVSPHILRHSCATHMLAHGADVRVVQELLGHASVATTQLYTKVTTEHLVRAYRDAHPRARGE